MAVEKENAKIVKLLLTNKKIDVNIQCIPTKNIFRILELNILIGFNVFFLITLWITYFNDIQNPIFQFNSLKYILMIF